MQDKIDFLRDVKIFEYLSDEEAKGLANIMQAYTFKTGSVLAYQRDVVEHFYVVAEGTIESFSVDGKGVITASKRFGPKDYFEDIWLFEQRDHGSTVRAASDGMLYVIDRGDFGHFLDLHPRVHLDMPESVWDAIDNVVIDETDSTFRSTIELLPDETIEYESRRAELLLAYYLLPHILFIVLMPIIFLGVLVGLFANPLSISMLLIAAALTIPAFIYAGYRYLDWANDHLVITSHHLIHTEFDLSTLSGTILKIPLDQVQSVKVQQPSALETMLKVGTVNVGTASQADGLIFDNISAPNEVEKTMSRIRRREKSLDEGRARAAIREAFESYYKVPDQIVRAEGDSAPAADARSKSKEKIKRQGNRSESGGTITYGRHWIVLILHIWWVLGLTFLTVLGMGAGWFFVLPLRSIWTLVVGGLLLLVEFGFIFYYYDDWSNDLFQVTNDSVIDIDRGSLSLTESRKVALLANVQNVQADRPNLWATFFGYGNVTIETAGGSADLVFENVANPNQVQTDIFARRELIRVNKTRGADRSRQQELALMLDEYQQLVEQGKIPKRTPQFGIDTEHLDEHHPSFGQ